MVRACLNQELNQFPILIDVKHMSARAREQFYAYRHKLLTEPLTGFKPPASWPIVATHMGVTGFRRRRLRDRLAEYGVEAANPFSVRMRVNRERAGQFKEGVFKENVFFNAASIGLFDDDIEEIAASDGLIGISLDARILGFQSLTQRQIGGPDYDFDYFSREDFAAYFPDLSRTLLPLPEEEEAATPPGVELAPGLLGQELLGQASRRTRELYLFCLNVLHVVAVIQALRPAAPRPAWEFVCLGSDYDGLIDSIKAARTVEQLPGFREELREFFPKAEKAYRKLRPGVGDLLPRAGGTLDVDAALDGLFYGNGQQFLSRWWG